MAGTTLKLIVGLGNPGEKYARTRHNAGFWFVDELARRHGGVFRAESKHLGEVARIRVTAEGGATPELWLLKPGTYMNKSGGSIASLANFYKVAPGEVLVAHDELDLPVGTARLKLGGGHGGHNGLRDTIAAIGADFGGCASASRIPVTKIWCSTTFYNAPRPRTSVRSTILWRAPPMPCPSCSGRAPKRR